MGAARRYESWGEVKTLRIWQPPMTRLDLPPSANNLFINVPGRGRAKTPQYRKWLRDAALTLSPVELLPPKTPVFVRMNVHLGRNRDLDNIVKPVIDALAGAGVIPDDRYVDEIYVSCERTNTIKDQGVWVRASADDTA